MQEKIWTKNEGIEKKPCIALVVPPFLPIPAIKGGAIETIVTLFADINETEQRAIFEVFCIQDPEAQKLSIKYKWSNIHYLKPEGTTLWMRGKKRIKTVYKKLFNKNAIIGKYYRDVFRECKKINPDFIVAEGGDYSSFRKFSNHFGIKKMILHIHHNLLYSPEIGGIFGATISVSHFICNAWIHSCVVGGVENGQKNYVVVNAVDETLFQKRISVSQKRDLRNKYGVRDGDILLLYLGRIIKEKGVLELANAVLTIQNPQIKLLIVGNVDFAVAKDSKYLQTIKQLVKENPDRLLYEGYVDNKQVYTYAQSADLRILPSQCEEAVSLALLEGILCYTPLIVTNSGGMPEVICEDGTLIVEKGLKLEQNLIQAIQKVIAEPGRLASMKEANKKHGTTINKSRFYHEFIDVFEEQKKQEYGVG